MVSGTPSPDDLLDNLLVRRMASRRGLRVDESTVGDYFEAAAARALQLHGGSRKPCLERRRQTDGLGPVVSEIAVFDGYPHLALPKRCVFFPAGGQQSVDNLARAPRVAIVTSGPLWKLRRPGRKCQSCGARDHPRVPSGPPGSWWRWRPRRKKAPWAQAACGRLASRGSGLQPTQARWRPGAPSRPGPVGPGR